MNTINNTSSMILEPRVEPINPWREGVLFVLIGTSTLTIGVVFSILSLLMPILVVPWFITSIPTGLNEASTLIEYIQVFLGDVSGTLIASLILGFIAVYLYRLNKLLFQTMRVFDNKFKWMNPLTVIQKLNDWKLYLKIVIIIAIVFGVLFTIITQSAIGLSWEEWSNRGN